MEKSVTPCSMRIIRHNLSMTEPTKPIGVLFVCLGNICRSPLAEGVFAHLLRERGIEDRYHVDSCGTGNWHVGQPPDERSQEVALAHGVELVCIGRQLDPDNDFQKFELIIPMDRQNKRDLLEAGAPAQCVRLLRSYDPAMTGVSESQLDVPDPYWDETDGFEIVYQMVLASCKGMLDELTGQ
jgi:low molecular weight protein-tyrosine phosphatase